MNGPEIVPRTRSPLSDKYCLCPKTRTEPRFGCKIHTACRKWAFLGHETSLRLWDTGPAYNKDALNAERRGCFGNTVLKIPFLDHSRRHVGLVWTPCSASLSIPLPLPGDCYPSFKRKKHISFTPSLARLVNICARTPGSRNASRHLRELLSFFQALKQRQWDTHLGLSGAEAERLPLCMTCS